MSGSLDIGERIEAQRLASAWTPESRSDTLERRVVGVLLAMSWLSNLAGFVRVESLGEPTVISRGLAVVVAVVHPLLGFLVWKRLASLVVVELMCLLEACALILL